MTVSAFEIILRYEHFVLEKENRFYKITQPVKRFNPSIKFEIRKTIKSRRAELIPKR